MRRADDRAMAIDGFPFHGDDGGIRVLVGLNPKQPVDPLAPLLRLNLALFIDRLMIDLGGNKNNLFLPIKKL